MALTVREIADRIVRTPGVDKAALIERLRHWTREGLLTPIGDKHPGTGRQRQYNDSAVFDAAILNALADHGLQVGVQQTVLALGKHFLETRPSSGYLEIARFRDGQVGAFLHDRPMVHPQTELSLVLNLSELFKGLQTEE
jgi:DNA-binding transcriptional MerR regulator